MQHVSDHRIVQLVGTGAMAEVYLAYDEVHEWDVGSGTPKMLILRHAAGPLFVERFKGPRLANLIVSTWVVGGGNMPRTEGGILRY